jgi:hypothetical protein
MDKTRVIATLLALAATLVIAAPAVAGEPLVPAAPHVKWVNGPPPGGWWKDARAAEAGGTVWYKRSADKWDLAHEMGHAFIEQVLTASDRRRLQGPRVMRVNGPWVGEWGEVSPDEVAADWYANARLGQGPGFRTRTEYGLGESWDPGYGVAPKSPAHYRRFIKIINRAHERYERERFQRTQTAVILLAGE